MDTPEQGTAEAAADTGPSISAVTVRSRERPRLRPTRGLPSAGSPLGAETQMAPQLRAVACWPSASVCTSGLRCAPSGHVPWARWAGASWGRQVCARGPVRARAWSEGVSFGCPGSSEAKGSGSRSCHTGSRRPKMCPAQHWPLMLPDAGCCPLPEPR